MTTETQPTYSRWQSSIIIRASFASMVVVIAVVSLLVLRQLPLLSVAIPLVVLIALFHGLGVEVDDREIRLKFGIGLIRKTIPLAAIKSCRPVTNRWWWGWGIRYTGDGWMWNVAGLDAIELELKDGRRFRIGTGDPRGLQQAIASRLAGLA